jgi:hypothetical protein
LNLKIKLIIPILLIIIGFVSYFVIFQENFESKLDVNTDLITSDVMMTDGKKHIISLDKIRDGGPPKDGIPSIDTPKFSLLKDSQFVSDSDVVIGLHINGETKAYPLLILVWHEIVNDVVGGIPVAITYCPLCYTNQVFERIVDDTFVEFGTSGKLFNSNLVMYDRLTESYWSQALGIAITGELSGDELKTIPFDLITWGDWKRLYPDTHVLTTNTGHVRSYATDPYEKYYENPTILFPVEHRDDRISPKEIIIGVKENNSFKAYKQEDVESKIIINDKIDDTSLLLVSLFSGNTRIFDRMLDGDVLDFKFENGKILDIATESEWNYDGLAISGELKNSQLLRKSIFPGFWFSWVSFHPDTLIYGEHN